MSVHSTLRVFASVAALAASVFAGASSASAVGVDSLADGERLNTLSCGYDGAARLFSVDERSGDVSPVDGGEPSISPTSSPEGSEDPFYSCGWQAAFDPATGLSYYPLFESTSSVPEGRWTLRSVDTATGVSAQVAEFADDEVSLGLVIGEDGRAFSLTARSVDETFAVTFDSIDLGTGELRRISQPDLGSATSATLTIDRATGVLHIVTGRGRVGTIDPATGSTTWLGSIRLESGQFIPAAAFGADGSLWFLRRVADSTPEAVELGRIRPADMRAGAEPEMDPTYFSSLSFDGRPFDARALWISTSAAPVVPPVVVPAAPELAETGIDTQHSLFGGLAAGSLLLFGAGTMITVRALRRAQV